MSNSKPPVRAKTPTLSLSGPEKVSFLLLALGAERASRLLRRFDTEEINRIALTAATLRPIEPGDFHALVDEFSSRYASGPNFLATGRAIQDLLADLTRESEPAPPPPAAEARSTVWEAVAKLEPEVLRRYLAKERPQTAALVLSRLETSAAAAVLMLMEAPARSDIVRRILTLGPVREPVLQAIAAALEADLLADNGGSNLTGLARILNRLDKQTNAALLDDLARSRPEDAKKLRRMVFDFHDIIKLPPKMRGLVLDQLPTDKLVMALRETDPEFQSVLLACLSARSRRMAEAELASGAEVPRSEIVGARRAVVDIVLALVAKGAIAIGDDPNVGEKA